MKLILTIAISLQFLTAKAQTDAVTREDMFSIAITNFSTAPNYVVVTVKNTKTGEVKEICTEGPFLLGAMMMENRKWPAKGKLSNMRYFEFAKDSALRNIGFDSYSRSDLNRYAASFNINNIVERVKRGMLKDTTFSGSRREQTMFAHLMFNRGIMMTRGCIAGNICGLVYYKVVY